MRHRSPSYGRVYSLLQRLHEPQPVLIKITLSILVPLGDHCRLTVSRRPNVSVMYRTQIGSHIRRLHAASAIIGVVLRLYTGCAQNRLERLPTSALDDAALTRLTQEYVPFVGTVPPVTASTVARVCSGGLGLCPSGVQGKTPSHGSGSKAPPPLKLKAI